MARRTPQTFEKRRRELDKQMKRNAKIEARQARSAAKRETKKENDRRAELGLPPLEPEVVAPEPDFPDSSDSVNSRPSIGTPEPIIPRPGNGP